MGRKEREEGQGRGGKEEERSGWWRLKRKGKKELYIDMKILRIREAVKVYRLNYVNY